MRYVFMDNFRGFNKTLLPLRQITFLVGENSTGKSSFLKLLYVLSRTQFWFSPAYSLQEEAELGGFGDIVSAWSPDKSFFRVGILTTGRVKNAKNLSCGFSLLTFENRDGTPHVTRYVRFDNGRLMKLVFQGKRTKYKIELLNNTFQDHEDIIRFYLDIINTDKQDMVGFTLFPKSIPSGPPIPIALSMLNSIEKGKAIADNEISAQIPSFFDLVWMAPIRTRPQRFYDGSKKTFSPEGDHTPFLLRRTMRMKSRSKEFTKRLSVFGEESGLFETILPHSFSKSPQSPFEIMIKFTGAKLNINNVGYGISQVLPLVVEFFSTEKSRNFAVQQPEIHLHPRAQAALGDLLVQLALENKHGFFMETHSDFLIDRCRLNLAKGNEPAGGVQVIFFQRTNVGNITTVLPIDSSGKYPTDQPPEFRDFFIKEEMNLLEV